MSTNVQEFLKLSLKERMFHPCENVQVVARHTTHGQRSGDVMIVLESPCLVLRVCNKHMTDFLFIESLDGMGSAFIDRHC